MFIFPIPLPLIFGGDTKQRQISQTTNQHHSTQRYTTTNPQTIATPTQQEWRCFCLLNQWRQHYGQPPLEFSHQLLALARQHSYVQFQQQTMHHSTFPYGENIAKAVGVVDPVMTAIECWIHSPPHFQNIISPHARYSAIGIYVGNDNSHRPINEHDHWFTQLFQS